MIYEHASDWTWARASCLDGCGLKVTAELSVGEAKRCRGIRGWKMRRRLRVQMIAQLYKLGCPHVLADED